MTHWLGDSPARWFTGSVTQRLGDPDDPLTRWPLIWPGNCFIWFLMGAPSHLKCVSSCAGIKQSLSLTVGISYKKEKKFSLPIGSVTYQPDDSLARWLIGLMIHRFLIKKILFTYWLSDLSARWLIGSVTHRLDDSPARWPDDPLTRWPLIWPGNCFIWFLMGARLT